MELAAHPHLPTPRILVVTRTMESPKQRKSIHYWRIDGHAGIDSERSQSTSQLANMEDRHNFLCTHVASAATIGNRWEMVLRMLQIYDSMIGTLVRDMRRELEQC